jgi:hypothetical protein
MSRRSLLALLAIPVFFLAAIPAVAKKAKASKAPVVTSIHPLKLKIGQKLTIHGKNFIKGRHKDTVVFMGPGKRVVWVKADRASTRTITVTLPNKLAVLLADKSGRQHSTRLLIRVIAKKSGRSFTKRAKSPVVIPLSSTGVTAEACPGVSDPNGDSDGDLLSNGLEVSLKLNPCNPDSDGDGVPDGYEYQAALDYNRNANVSVFPYPYPGKRAYPNALDPTDASTDHDGDGLTMAEEYQGSKFVGYTSLDQIAYSDGDQSTGPVVLSASVDPTYASYADMNHDGVLEDDEKDADGDGLTNWDELKGRMTQAWWTDVYKNEPAYPLTYDNVNWLDRDTDGDGVPDGADDQDHDGYTNVQELSRSFADTYFSTHNGYDSTTGAFDIPPLTAGEHAFTNPVNPCLPNPQPGPFSLCMEHPPLDSPPSPFNGTPTNVGGPFTHQIEWPVQWDPLVGP